MVQVYYHNTWGWVCADLWDKHDADVACKQLGYERALAFGSQIIGENEVKNAWLNNLKCFGHERSIFLCPHDEWKNHLCSNNRKANVVCSGVEGRKYPYSRSVAFFLYFSNKAR